MESKKLFQENYRCCKECGRELPENYEGEICPNCQEQQLFYEVRDYIRSENVTERDVADHFQIPIRKVRSWIREGRIEYREDEKPALTSLHCMRCGKQIYAGTYCPECNKIINGPVGVVLAKEPFEQSKMRYMEKNIEKKE